MDLLIRVDVMVVVGMVEDVLVRASSLLDHDVAKLTNARHDNLGHDWEHFSMQQSVSSQMPVQEPMRVVDSKVWRGAGTTHRVRCRDVGELY